MKTSLSKRYRHGAEMTFGVWRMHCRVAAEVQ